jgi:uncharacterized protein (TIGR02246 family)
MRQRVGLSLTVVVALAITAVTGYAQAPKARVEPAISKLAKEYSDAFNAKDAARAAALYMEDAVLNPANQPAVRGRANIEAMLKKEIEMGLTGIVLTPIESSISGSLAYETGTYSISLKPSTGASLTDKGKYLVVLKQVGGKWLVAHDMSNSDLPPPPAPAASPAP